jgi:hypothetical protein
VSEAVYPDREIDPAELEKLTEMLMSGEICCDTYFWMQGIESALDRLEDRRDSMPRRQYYAIRSSMERRLMGLDAPKTDRRRRKKQAEPEPAVETADSYFEIANAATGKTVRIPFNSKHRAA